MRRNLRLLVLGSLAALVLVIPPAAHADDVYCGVAGSPAFGFLVGGTYDNVVVPEGASCFIQGAVIKGNVKALPDSHVLMVITTVGGNVVGDKADLVQVTLFSSVGGDIHIKEGGPNLRTAHQEVLICGVDMPNGDILVEKMRIAQGLLVTGGFCEGPNEVKNGNVTIQDNVILAGTPPASGMHIDSNQIANGNLHVFKNLGPGAKDVVFNNVLKGDIQCYGNSAPFVGGPNVGRAPNQPPFMVPPLSGQNQCVGTST